ncbi:MAG: DUF350 domain-containing protein [Elusimicrobia bacterium]|nr:DUF350 domain-containing protein [Elusimicrobiota bacterium]
MREVLNVSHLVAAIVYSALGLSVFCVFFQVVDKLTPYDLWQELVQKQNRALATVVGSFALGLSIIIAASLIG